MQVARLADAGNGEFVASLGIYRVPEDADADRYGTPVEELRRSGHEVRLEGEACARVRRVREGGEVRYVLIGYALVADVPAGATAAPPRHCDEAGRLPGG